MEIIQLRPFDGFGLLREGIDDLWKMCFENTLTGRGLAGDWLPFVDVSETKNDLIIRIELPGVQADDVSVSISGNLLTIRGEKKKEEDEKEEYHYYVERYYGPFLRAIHLPIDVKSTKIEATFDKGILKIVFPKTEDAKEIEIEVK